MYPVSGPLVVCARMRWNVPAAQNEESGDSPGDKAWGLRTIPSHSSRFGVMFVPCFKAQSTQDAGRDAQCDASKWDLLM